MYKASIFIITVLFVLLSIFLAQAAMPEDCPKNLFWTQASFLAVSEIWAGLAASGCLCFGKNAFEPFHIAQIFLSVVYVVVAACLMLLIYTKIGIMGALAADFSALFAAFAATLLLGTANFYQKSKN